LLGHLLSGRVATTIETSAHDEPAAVGRVADEADDRLVRAQGSAAPVHGDEREQSVLDLVPLARARGEVADADRDAVLVGEALELALPHARTVPVAATCVRGDEDLAHFRVALRAYLFPPCLDRGD